MREGERSLALKAEQRDEPLHRAGDETDREVKHPEPEVDQPANLFMNGDLFLTCASIELFRLFEALPTLAQVVAALDNGLLAELDHAVAQVDVDQQLSRVSAVRYCC